MTHCPQSQDSGPAPRTQPQLVFSKSGAAARGTWVLAQSPPLLGSMVPKGTEWASQTFTTGEVWRKGQLRSPSQGISTKVNFAPGGGGVGENSEARSERISNI